MKKTLFSIFFIPIFILPFYAQNSFLEGYIFEESNTGYVDKVTVEIFNKNNSQLVAKALTNKDGFFSAQLPAGRYYDILTKKNLFKTEKTSLFVKFSDKNKRIFTKIKMSRNQDANIREQFGYQSNRDITGTNKRLSSNTNTEGLPLSEISDNNVPHAQVTNATRLAEETYDNASHREQMKLQSMPTVYKSTIKIQQPPTVPETAFRSKIPSNYNLAENTKKIIKEKPRLGETIVASATSRPSGQPISQYYTGYKIEFLTGLNQLTPTHEIFNRHGQIAIEKQPNGIYSYLLGNFQERHLAEIFLKEQLIERYPSANIVYFENGKRLKNATKKRRKTKPTYAPPR